MRTRGRADFYCKVLIPSRLDQKERHFFIKYQMQYKLKSLSELVSLQSSVFNKLFSAPGNEEG